MLDGSHNSFWASTGLFPQELIIGFKEEIKISEIKTTSRNGEHRCHHTTPTLTPTLSRRAVKAMSIDRIIPGQATVSSGKPAWKNVVTKELVDTKTKMQVEVHMMNNLAARFLRITVESGFDAFVAIYSIRIQTSEGKWIC